MVSILHLQNYKSVMRYLILRLFFWQDAALDRDQHDNLLK